MISDLRQSLDRLDEEIRVGQLSPEQHAPRRMWIFKEFLQRERERLKYEHETGATGRHVVHQWTAVVDALVAEAYRTVIRENESLAGDCAVVAQGGYGRGHLNIRSDVDLLFLFRRSMPDESPIVKEILQLLWDLDFDLGHATRTVDDALSFAATDDVTRTALLDARFLAGYGPVYDDFVARYRERFLENHGRSFAQQKAGALEQRRASHGGHAQVLEPNIKESTGGLRDLHTLQWIMNARKGSSELDALVEHHVLSQRDLRSLESAVDFLWRVRNDLHFLQKRKHDRLDFDKQPIIAERLGYQDSTKNLGVEQFMRDYYMTAREVARISDVVCHKLTRSTSRTTQMVDIMRRRVLDDGSVLVRGKILLPRKRSSFFRDDPHRLLSIFDHMGQHQAEMSATASRNVHANLDLVDDAFRHDEANAARFREIMSRTEYLSSVLREMHYTGLLGQYMPEFGRLTCLVQHDYYHAFTADEHSIVTVERLEELLAGSSADDSAGGGTMQSVATVYRGIPDKQVLHTACLLHDVGKSGGHRHAERGAEMSVKIAERLGFNQKQQDLIGFLVAHHLDLSHISERRDLSDLAMLEQFAEHFDSVTSLDMLYVLTWADMNATQAEPVSRWKTELMQLLYLQVREVIRRRDERVGHDENTGADAMLKVLESPAKFTEQLGKIIGQDAAYRHMYGLPRRYPLLYTLDEASRHAQRAEQIHGQNEVLIDVEEPAATGRVTVYTRDRTSLLSDICGILTVNDLNIQGADAFTRADGVIVDVFTVRGLADTETKRAEQTRKLEADFHAVWSGETRVEDMIAQHRRRWARKKIKAVDATPRVVFDNETSEPYTVVDVFARDRIGFLYDVSRILSAADLDIHMARIGTDADQVADAFYVTDMTGKKLADEDPVCNIVRNLLLDVLG